MRINLINLNNGNIADHSSGHISNEEGAQLIGALYEELRECLGDRPFRMYPGFSYRHLLVLEGDWGSPEVELVPPHDNVGGAAADLLPKRLKEDEKAVATEAFLIEMIERSRKILANHPVNLKRKAQGKVTADSLWPWSPGRRPEMKTLIERFNIRPAVISAVDLVKGLGVYAGARVIDVPGATGLYDTNYEGKAEAALYALKNHDFVYCHVEATDEAGHARDLELKIKCIEMLDQRLVKLILEGLEERGIEASVAVLPDHPTYVETGKHGSDPVPVAIRIPGVEPDHVHTYTEKTCAQGSLGMLKGDEFIRGALNLL
jgi:2,3-bisphosphoglycerate-independent phosphoglycerate mutase